MAKLWSLNADSMGQAANPAALFTSVSEVGGTVSLATLAGMPGKHLAITGDGANAAKTYVRKTISPAASTLVVRVLIELSADFANGTTASGDVIKLLNATAQNILTLRYNRTSNALNMVAYQDAGSQTGTPGVYGPSTMVEYWLAAKITNDADGYTVIGGTTSSAGRCMVYSGANDNRGNIATLQIGMDNTATDWFAGSMYVHEIDVWDAKPDELEDIHFAAGASDYRSGLPAVLDIEAPTGGTVTAIDVRRNGGDWQAVSMASVTSTRPDAKAFIAELTTADLDEATGTFDGCLVSGTAAPGTLLPDVQVVKHLQGDGVGTILLSSCPRWLSVDEVGYTVAQPAQTFSVWRWAEKSAGVYRVGLPGSVIGCGNHELRLTFADETTATTTFTAYAIGRGELSDSPPGGKHVAVGYDDGLIQHPCQYRATYASRTPNVRPTFWVASGMADSYLYAPWSAWRLMQRSGCMVGNHMFDRRRHNEYATDAEAEAYLLAARDAMWLQGVQSRAMAWVGGVALLPSGGSGVPYALTLWLLARGSSGTYRNALPITQSATVNAGSVNSSTFAGEDDAAHAAALVAAMDAAGAAPAFYIYQHHEVGDTAGYSTQGFVSGCIDAAIAAGYRYERLDRLLAASEE